MTNKEDAKISGVKDSLDIHYKQGSLSTASDKLKEVSFGKGYSQGRLDPKKQSSISSHIDASGQESKRDNAVLSQSSLSDNTALQESKQEGKHSSKEKKLIVPVITFVLGLLVAMLIFRIFNAFSSNDNKDTNEAVAAKKTEEVQESFEAVNSQFQDENAEIGNQAEKKTATPDTIIDIPDPELKKAIQKALGIENRDITVADALSLESLECSNKGGAYINDLTGISAFTNLKELVIYISKITDISPLNSLTSLTHLELLNSPVTDITPLANLTNLTNLELGCCQITDISPLTNLTGLTELNLTGNKISDFSPLTSLINLTTLVVVSESFCDISPLENLTNLTYLNLLDDQISDISPLKGLKNLTFLALEDNRIVDIKPLANMENLKTLILTDNQIDDISPLANLPNLIVLHIIGNPVVENLTREEMLDVLSGAENLQYLDYGAKPTERVSPMISSLLLTTGTLDVYHLLIS